MITLKVKKQGDILQPVSDLNRVTIRPGVGVPKILSTLNDVVVVDQSAGAVPIYGVSAEKFEIRPLVASDIDIDEINGGTY